MPSWEQRGGATGEKGTIVRHLRGAAIGLVLAMLTVSCGSTVQPRGGGDVALTDVGEVQDGQVDDADAFGLEFSDDDGMDLVLDDETTDDVPPAGASLGAGAPATSSGGRTPAAGPSSQPAAPGEGPSGAQPPAQAASGQPGDQGGGSAPAPATARDTGPKPPIKVGLHFNQGADQAASDLGLEGISFGDQRAQFEIVIADLNERGGLDGHPVEGLYHPQDSASTDNRQVQEQAACTHWTQDNDAKFVVSIVGYTDVLPTCLAEAGVPLVTNWSFATTAFYKQLAGHMWTPGHMALDRGVQVMARELHGQGFFVKDARVGILYSDDTQSRVAHDTLKAELAALGVPVASEYGVADLARDMNAAVLRFQSDAVDHVLFVMQGGAAFIFMNAAEGQQYRPRYGLSSFDHPAAAETLAPVEQLKGAVGIGWRPTIDVGMAQLEHNAAARRCLDLLAQHGYTHSDGNGMGFALATCDVLGFLEHAVRAGGGPSVDGLRRGAPSLGTSYVSPLTFTTRFGADRFDGPTAYRHLAFKGDCSCFAYTSGVTPLR